MKKIFAAIACASMAAAPMAVVAQEAPVRSVVVQKDNELGGEAGGATIIIAILAAAAIIAAIIIAADGGDETPTSP